jgi:hypothetical protein
MPYFPPSGSGVAAVAANADSSVAVTGTATNPIVGVGILAADAQHGNRGGGALHANVVAAGAAGFMTGADKTKIDSVATSAAALGATAGVLVSLAAGIAGVAATAAHSDHTHALDQAIAPAWTGVHTWTNAAVPVTSTITDAGAATQLEAARFQHLSSVAGTSGNGVYASFWATNDAPAIKEAARIMGTLTTVTAGAEVSSCIIQTRSAGGALTTAVTIGGTGGVGALTAVGDVIANRFMLVSGSYNFTVASNLVSHTLANSRFGHAYTRTAPISGSDQMLKYTSGGSTGRTASTEIPDYDFNIGTRQWAAGAITTQREFLVRQPTYSFVGASTITQAATLAVVGMPIAGTNATLTESMSLWTQDGLVRHDLVDAATAANTDVMVLEHRSSGTVANNFGTGLLFRGQDAAGTAGGDDIGRLNFIWTTATSGSEVSQFQIQTRSAGAALANLLTVNSSNTVCSSVSFFVGGNSIGINTTSPSATFVLANSRFSYVWTRTAPISGTTGYFTITPGNSTGQTASTEISNFVYSAHSRQWAAGAITTQREALWNAPTYTAVSASTITNAATMAIAAAPIASTNITITNAYALWVQADKSRFDGRVIMNAPSSAIADADLPASSLSFYLNEGGNTVTVKAKYADGTTIKTGTIAIA